MSNYTRSATKEDLKSLINSLNENNVEYFLIGGYALFAHGYNRATTDIDILVPNSLSNGENVIKALMFLPDQAVKEIDPNWFIDVENEDNGNIRVADQIVIDIMFNACGQTYESLKEYEQIIEVEDIVVKTINLEGLIKTKQTTREKDINDRHVLERAINAIKIVNYNKNKM